MALHCCSGLHNCFCLFLRRKSSLVFEIGPYSLGPISRPSAGIEHLPNAGIAGVVHHAQLWTPLNNRFNFSVCVHGCACSVVYVKARGQPYGLQSTLLPLLLWTKFKTIWISQQPPRPALSSASLEAVFPSLSVIVRSWPALLLQPTLWFRFLKLTS